MDLLEAIRTTRAIRRFTDEPVTDEEIITCIRAAVQAPNGGNIQPWQFLAVTDPEIKRQIGEVYLRAYNRYEPAALKLLPPFRSEEEATASARNYRSARHLAEHLGQVPAMVLVLMLNIPWTLHDDEGEMDIGPLQGSLYPAVQNLILAARGLGIGATLTTVFRIYQDEVRRICGVPDRYEIAALVPLGRPRGTFGVAPRRPAEQVTHWNRFGNRGVGR
jgi:nitroreductase